MNEAGHQLVRLGDGIVLRQGRIGAKHGTDAGPFLALIRDAAERGGAGGGPIRLSRDGGGAYVALIAPLARDRTVASPEPTALILICDPAATATSLGTTLIKLYGFSHAEARLAMLLTQGRTLKQAAEKRGVGIETVRSQMRSLLAKSGVHRQADLVRLIARLPEIGSILMPNPLNTAAIEKG